MPCGAPSRILTDANLGDHAIAARTHVHLAAVYMTGFNDRTKAIRQFVMALKNRPQHQDHAAGRDRRFGRSLRCGPRPGRRRPSRERPRPRPRARRRQRQRRPQPRSKRRRPAVLRLVRPQAGRRGLRGAKKFADQEEPAPPARVPEPFYCPLPDEVPPKEDILVRCVTQKQPRRATATVFYREKGSEDFTPLPMTRSPKGWLTATVPGAAVTGSAFQYYLEAKVPGSKEPLSIGSADGPNLMPIVDGAAPVNNRVLAALLEGKDTSTKTAPMAEDKAPLEEINRQYQIDEELRKYHRRLPGSVFISFGGGAWAQTYHGATALDSHDTYHPTPSWSLTGTPPPAPRRNRLPVLRQTCHLAAGPFSDYTCRLQRMGNHCPVPARPRRRRRRWLSSSAASTLFSRLGTSRLLGQPSRGFRPRGRPSWAMLRGIATSRRTTHPEWQAIRLPGPDESSRRA